MTGENKKKKIILEYTKEKLYELLPAVYRQYDANQGRPLEALLEVIARQVRVIEEDIGGLHDNWFIETCDEWVTSYLADLVGASSLSSSKASAQSESPISQRAYIANTIGFRRRKGTVAMLEQLARDVTQWGAHAVEFFQLLGTTQNLNHLRPTNHRTPDLRKTAKLELLNTPFDTIGHTVEVRRIESGRGYYNVPNIGLFLWRLVALPSIQTPAFRTGEKKFTFHPLGYDDIPLFNTPVTEISAMQISGELNVPSPIRMRAFYDHRDLYYGAGKSILLSVKYAGEAKWTQISARNIMVCTLSKWCSPEEGKVAIDPVLGRISLAKDAASMRVSYYYGFGRKMGGGFYERQQAKRDDISRDFDGKEPTVYKVSRRQSFVWSKIPNEEDENSHLRDILRNDFGIEWVEENIPLVKNPDGSKIEMTHGTKNLSISLLEDSARLSVENHEYDLAVRKYDGTIYVSKEVGIYESIAEALLWWKKDRENEAVIEIIDSEGYSGNLSLTLPAGYNITIRAAQEERPILHSLLQVQGETGSKLVLDGLWIYSSPNSNPNLKVMPGDMESIVIRDCTLVPGRDEATRKAGIVMVAFIRRFLCSWDDLEQSNSQAALLAKFLNEGLGLQWVKDDAVFVKDPADETKGETERVTHTAGNNSLSIELAKSEYPFVYVNNKETLATLRVKEAESTWEKVYEFTIMTENGKRNMYLKGPNDDLEVTLENSICGSVSILDSPLFIWNRILLPSQEGDRQYLRDFLKSNFFLPWLENDAAFESAGPNTIIAKSQGHSLSFTRTGGRVTLSIDGIIRHEFMHIGNRVFSSSDAVLEIKDTIVDGMANNQAIEARRARVENSTVIGKTRVDIMDLATNSIFTEMVDVRVRQQGCIRFSYVSPESKTPQKYKCVPDDDLTLNVRPSFTSTRYADPGYAQLHKHVDHKILEGADNGAEMGAFNSIYEPQRINDLQTALKEYLRVGLEAGIFLVT